MALTVATNRPLTTITHFPFATIFTNCLATIAFATLLNEFNQRYHFILVELAKPIILVPLLAVIRHLTRFSETEHGICQHADTSTHPSPSTMAKTSKKRKRDREEDSVWKKSYQGCQFRPRDDSGEPGTPHRFFRSSFDARLGFSSGVLKQVVHRHVNGLCVVTVGDELPDDVSEVKVLPMPTTNDCSNGEKRKMISRILRGGGGETPPCAVTPQSVLAHLILTNGNTIPIHAGVLGVALEMNEQLTTELLKRDPLLDGYIAVILPAGSFPPQIDTTQEAQNDRQEKHTSGERKKDEEGNEET